MLALDQEIAGLRTRLEQIQASGERRTDVLDDLSTRFASILTDFRFPKLSQARLSRQFVPYVRGKRYNKIGSAGALTLTSVAWMLAIFERAVSTEASHPGFLMIDSPQKNLTPRSNEVDSEFHDPAIVRGVYDHMIRWAASTGSGAQLILVDNAPPRVAESSVVVRYSADPDHPPYGLIEDETQ